MKVPEANSSHISSVGGSSPITSSGAARSSSKTAVRGDEVQISSLSSALKNIDSPAHASKLVELSSAVSSGRYQIDSNAVSDKLIQEHLRPAA